MVRMVVMKEHQYRGRRLHAGEEYDCEPQHVSVFERLGWARPAERKAEEETVTEPRRELAYSTRRMEAEEPRRANRGRRK